LSDRLTLASFQARRASANPVDRASTPSCAVERSALTSTNLKGQFVREPSVETELKFLVTSEHAGALFKHRQLRGETSTHRLRSVYYDTPDLDLRKAGITLRVRQTDHGFVQTVKMAADDNLRRGEWESSVGNENPDRKALAKTPAAEILGGKAGSLTPMFSTTVERRTRLTRFRDAQIEVSFDHGELSSGEAREPIEELELELKSGEASSLFGLAREFCRARPIRLSLESKADRGRRLRDDTSADPRKSEPINLVPTMGSAEAFQQIARACLAQVTANAELLRLIRLPEALHQLRIGLRRLRTATAVFKTMLAGSELDAVERELKWLAGELDAARDIEVFGRATFLAVGKATVDSGLPQLGRHLRSAKRKAYDRALLAVESQRYAMLVLEEAAWIDAGAWTRAEDPVLSHLRSLPISQHRLDALDHLRRVVCHRGRRLDRLDATSRHKLRIRAKRLR
jgi:triphosphatase